VLLGISAGAALVAVEELARLIATDPDLPAVIVTVLPDGADRYLSEKWWNE
jgi:cysteine synthase